jgi:hypothetical protein
MTTLTAGTVANFEGSLAESIEDAFAGELYAVKQLQLPQAGKQERRILFCAIAQAMLAYLAANPEGLQVALSENEGLFTGGGTVDVQAPTLAPAGGGAVSGTGWPGGPVTITATASGASQTVSVDSKGGIGVTLPTGTSGVIDARDGTGNAAQAVI